MQDNNEQRNLIMAIALSVAILIGFQFLFDKPTPTETAPQPIAPTAAPGQPAPGAPVGAATTAAEPRSRAQTLEVTKRVPVRTPRLNGSVALKGARFDDLTLVQYHVRPDPKSPEIELLSPVGSPAPYYAEFGWVPAAGQTVALPGPETEWQTQGQTLTPDAPLVLTWDNGQGLRFTRTIVVDKDYMFTVTQRVENQGQQPVTLLPYGLVNRIGKPKIEDMYLLHEGPVGVVDGTLKEKKYKDLDEEGTFQQASTGGWVGITDKYWLTAIAPGSAEPVTLRMSHHRDSAVDKYQTDFLGAAVTIQPGAAGEDAAHFFAGAKQLELLDDYGDKYGIDRFDLAIDFGWFYFMTKPFFYILKFLHGVLGNFGLAIMGLTVLVKLALFPLANKSYKAMSKMKKLQPEVQKLQERFADDRQRLNQEMMALYRREKANPVAGCLPVFIQIPVFFALYKVLFVTIEMRHAPFYGWIHDLSAPDPTNLFTLFGLIPWTPPAFLPLMGIWPLIMGVTMWLQQKLNPQPTDPVQAKIFMFLPIMFTFMLASFPAGLVIYWAWSNTLSILQQWVIMRRMGVKP